MKRELKKEMNAGQKVVFKQFCQAVGTEENDPDVIILLVLFALDHIDEVMIEDLKKIRSIFEHE